MLTSADNRGKLFSLLSIDKYNQERLLLPTSTGDPVIIENKKDEKLTSISGENQAQVKSFPPTTGYIKYPAYDFF